MEYLTVREVAQRIKRHPETVRDYIRGGKLKAVRTGEGEGQLLISEAALLEFLRPVKTT